MNETPRLRSAFPSTPRPNPYWRSKNGNGYRFPSTKPSPNPTPVKEVQADSSTSSETLIPLNLIDAPTQRLYVAALYVGLAAWRLYDFWQIRDDLDSTWLFLKWIGCDAAFFVALPALRIPWLEWSFFTTLAIWLLHVVASAFLMYRIPIPIGIWFGALVKIFYDREAGLSSDRVNPANIRTNSSIILGKQIIQILPEGSAILNPDRIPLCLNSTTTFVEIPIQINQTTPILIELLRIDLDTSDNETITINAKQARQLKRQAEKGYHKSNTNTPRTLRYPTSKTGLYRLQRVVDESNLEVRKRSIDTAVVSCPQASLSTANDQRCSGELSNVALEVRGVPPFQVKYSKRINHQQFSSIVQSIQPVDLESPLTADQLPSILTHPSKPYIAWTKPATVSVDISESLNQNGSWLYSLEEVEDGFGNRVEYDTESQNGQASSQRQSLVVHNRPKVSLVDCDAEHYLRVAKSQSTNLPVRLRPSGQLASQDWPLKLTYSFVPEASGSDALAETYIFEMTDDQSMPRVSKAGKYNVESVESMFCLGEVNEPSSCLLYNPPTPGLALQVEDIIDKCAGNPIGLLVHLDFTGTPPFQVRYLTVNKGTANSKTAKFNTMRGQIELKEHSAGSYTYQFLDVQDQVYPPISLRDKNLVLQQDIRPPASAAFLHESGTLKACLGQPLGLDVKLMGEEPWTLDYEIVHGGKRKKFSVHSETDVYSIMIPEVNEGGTQSIVLTAVQDKSKCRTNIQQERTIEVRPEQPFASFAEVEGRRSILALEGQPVKLPLRLKGLAPWAVLISNLDYPSEPAKQHILREANAEVSVERPGTYELQSVHDSCPGLINPAAKTFKVSWVERPSLSIKDERMQSIGEREYRMPAVCNGDEVAFGLGLAGNPPYHVKYLQKVDPLKGSMAISSKSVSLANNLAFISMDTSRAGEYTYTFTELSDDRYSYDKKSFESMVVRQQVYALPSAKFANPGKTFGYCKDDAGGSENIPISLEGIPPFSVELGIIHHGTAKPEIVRIKDIPSNTFSWSLSHHILGLGAHVVHIRKVIDSRGCEKTLDQDPSAVRIMVSDPPTIFPLESQTDYCVGERVSYSLSGQPPFEIFYQFRGKERKAKVPNTEFRRLAEAPGEFTITAISDSASGNCRANKNLTKIIHPMPSVKISRGKTAVADIHEGGEVEILFEFTGTPPFEFT
jgi:nucleoporin POM152